MFKSRFLRELAESLYALAVMVAIGRWSIRMAYLERGYEAVGGECFLVIATYCVAWKAIHNLFDTLEESYERSRKKRRSRGTARI